MGTLGDRLCHKPDPRTEAASLLPAWVSLTPGLGGLLSRVQTGLWASKLRRDAGRKACDPPAGQLYNALTALSKATPSNLVAKALLARGPVFLRCVCLEFGPSARSRPDLGRPQTRRNRPHHGGQPASNSSRVRRI
jgi:hypothetical protein